MVIKTHLFVIFFAIAMIGFVPFSFAQGVQTAGGANVDGSWYLGEDLKTGDYFEYSLCELDLNDCAPITLKMWISGDDLQNESETLWDAKVVILDGNKVVKGTIGLGKIAPEPVLFDDDLHDYAIAFKSSLSWLSAFATADNSDRIHGPKEFRDTAWGKIGAIGGGQLIPKRTETVATPAGIFDTVVVGWYSGENNEIWLVDGFPFPVKALTYAWVTTGIAPVMYQYTLLNYKENILKDPFEGYQSSVTPEMMLDCETDFDNYTSRRVSTNTHSMMIQYNYSPEFPKEGCNIDWKINFMNKYNEVQFVDQVHYDVWVVDEDGNRLRSHARDIGRADLFNGFGQVHLLLPVQEEAGVARYAIFVHGTGPKLSVTDASTAGYAIVEIPIAKNVLLEKIADGHTLQIPDWVKNNAGWWADGIVDDDSFVYGLEFLIKQNIVSVPVGMAQTSDVSGAEIPDWVKNNAGWWADGIVDDDSFVQLIESLIQQGVIKI